MTQSREDKLYRQFTHLSNLVVSLQQSMRKVQGQADELTKLALQSWLSDITAAQDQIKRIQHDGGM